MTLPALAEPTSYTPGHWPITALRLRQCRFACTSFDAPRDGHLFCGERTAGVLTPYCEGHRSIVYRTGSVEIDADEGETEGMAA